MSKAKVKATGVAKMKTKVKSYKSQAKKVIRQAMRANMRPILTQAKANAPVQTGTLVKAIRLRAGKGKKGSIVIRVIVGSANFVGHTYYGAIVEFGSKGPKGQKAQHYMLRAYESGEAKAKTDTIRDIKAGLKSLKP
jgi:HK97 gp10 family phage protein